MWTRHGMPSPALPTPLQNYINTKQLNLNFVNVCSKRIRNRSRYLCRLRPGPEHFFCNRNKCFGSSRLRPGPEHFYCRLTSRGVREIFEFPLCERHSLCERSDRITFACNSHTTALVCCEFHAERLRELFDFCKISTLHVK